MHGVVIFLMYGVVMLF